MSPATSSRVMKGEHVHVREVHPHRRQQRAHVVERHAVVMEPLREDAAGPEPLPGVGEELGREEVRDAGHPWIARLADDDVPGAVVGEGDEVAPVLDVHRDARVVQGAVVHVAEVTPAELQHLRRDLDEVDARHGMPEDGPDRHAAPHADHEHVPRVGSYGKRQVPEQDLREHVDPVGRVSLAVHEQPQLAVGIARHRDRRVDAVAEVEDLDLIECLVERAGSPRGDDDLRVVVDGRVQAAEVPRRRHRRKQREAGDGQDEPDASPQRRRGGEQQRHRHEHRQHAEAAPQSEGGNEDEARDQRAERRPAVFTR
jgi:hypothetical protein